MKDKHLWFGYLQAGAKSSLVVGDSRVESGGKSSMYLYNHLRKEMVEYRRDIVEAKLRDARPDEYNAEELAKAFQQALRRSKPILYQALFAPGSRAPATKKTPAARHSVSSDEDVDIDEEIFLDDDAEEENVTNDD